MMKYISLACMLTLMHAAFAQPAKYLVDIDLTKTKNDQVPVTVTLPSMEGQFVEYHMPKIVPGTYSISDFGRFVDSLKAYNSKGEPLKTEKIAANRWRIKNNDLKTVSYWVNDTWDSFEGYEENIVFEPGGTNIDREEDVYVMNTFGFIGYIKGQKFLPYELTVRHSPKIFGASALEKKKLTDSTDMYYAADFNFLADGPIMYNKPDTAVRQIANARILVSVYSPNKKLSAKDVMNNIYDLMVAQSKYLGGQLPVDRYAYLIYLNDEATLSGAMGALEHSYSSVYSLPEAGADKIAQTVRDVAAHEFFHIVTPLNIHSREIGEFDYIDPKMSQHLWLYEGVTEYSSMHVQVKYGLYGKEQFLEEVQDKLRVAESFPSVSFTEMSKKILEPEYEPMYVNVYYKGALIGMCLDLYLIKHSDGQQDLPWLMRELAKTYGKEISFEDDSLFNTIELLTNPKIREFLDTYVAGSEPLPIEEVLDWAGIEYIPVKTVKEISMGNIGLTLNENNEIAIDNLEEANEFAQNLGYKVGDVILKLNKKDFNLSNVQELIEDFKANTKPGDKVRVEVKRKEGDKWKKVKLKAKAIEIEKEEKHFLNLQRDITDEQKAVRAAWLNTKK